MDATTIQLIARCLDWAKHRRRKAAAKCHLRLDLQTFLPRFAIVGTAGEHDNLRTRELCAGVRAVSRFHKEHPLILNLGGQEYRLDYEPGESQTNLFGGNSNCAAPSGCW